MQDFLFVLSKAFRAFAASPLCIALVLAVAALAAVKTEKGFRRFLKRLGILSCGAVFVLGMPLTADALSAAWETPRGNMALLAELGPFDAAIVLGGSQNPAVSAPGHVELNDAVERLTGAAFLYRAGVVRKVVFTGGSGLTGSGPAVSEAPEAGMLLQLMGVPARDIVLEGASRNTYENAVLTAPLLDAMGARRTVLVTSAFHMRRSAAIFQKQGIDFEPYAVDTRRNALPLPLSLAPEAWALTDSTAVLREMVGIVAYRFLGRL